jgi:hypothetical protein
MQLVELVETSGQQPKECSKIKLLTTTSFLLINLLKNFFSF